MVCYMCLKNLDDWLSSPTSRLLDIKILKHHSPLYEHIESSFAKATVCAVICEYNFSKVELNRVAPIEHTKAIICERKSRKTGFGIQL
uniref:Uncharacterized protein n=1 Tax=Arundo donax TaxID=35708 RepID=A0A0A9CNY2_ARUDO